MRVFISWSGEQSHVAAVALGQFLAKPWSTNVKTFVSSVDIEAGAQWQADILGELDSSNFGVICVTRANQARPWVNFEAGAIAKKMSESRCVPLAIDLKPAEVQRPLGMYQAKAADRPGVWALVEAINNALQPEIRPDKEALEAQFNAFWPELAAQLEISKAQEDTAQSSPESAAQTQADMVAEILTTVRALASRTGAPASVEGRGTVREKIVQGIRDAVEGIDLFDQAVLDAVKDALLETEVDEYMVDMNGPGRVQVTTASEVSDEDKARIQFAVRRLGVAPDVSYRVF